MAKVVRSRKMLGGDDLRYVEKYRFLFRKLCAGESIVVITDTVQEPEDIFGTYYKVFNLYIKRGTCKVLSITEIDDDEDMENFYFL